jgi:hypothetical protein
MVRFLVPRLRAWQRGGRLVFHDTYRRILLPEEPFREFVVSGKAREEILQELLVNGWQPGEATDPWDAGKPHTKVLLATCHDDHGGKFTMIRIWGDDPLEPLNSCRSSRRIQQ